MIRSGSAPQGADLVFPVPSMIISGYEVHALDAGRFALDGGAMYGVVPRPLWEQRTPPDARNRIAMMARSLLLSGHGRHLLVDTGNGTKFTARQKDIYRIPDTPSPLVTALAGLGLTPADITDVLLTHLHFDHAGGSTCVVEGRVVPAFPGARYYVQKDHWEAAQRPTERDRASFVADDYLPLMEHGVLDLLDGPGVLLPGIRLQLFHGHTTALQCPVISDGRTTLVFCADVIPMLPHVQLPWIMGYDLRPLITLEEKRTLVGAAVEEGWVLMLQHDPEVAAVRLARDDRGSAVAEKIDLPSAGTAGGADHPEPRGGIHDT